jgi:hypothetical protein
MAVPENQGGAGESAIDAVASGGNRRSGVSGKAGLSGDVGELRSLNSELTKTERIVKSLTSAFTSLKRASSGAVGTPGGGGGGGAPGTPEGSMRASKDGLVTRMGKEFVTGGWHSQGGMQGANMGLGIAGASRAVGAAAAAPIGAISQGVSGRIGRGAAYSLSADRMSVLYQQMYGMTNEEVRSNVRTPMTENYLLGGPGAINTMMSMQASTGLSAIGQSRSVEAFRTMSGFSLDTAGATQMLSTMASPEVANRMFMMGGTGMYGIGGKQQGGMKVIQDIVRRTGLTNPDALKGALQQGSNTRQRLSAMGVPQDMQDMVIQYAMQNTQYQKKTNTTTMYDPSLEDDRRTMGIEGSYAVQHEKTSGEMAKREERFYGRQVDNFADFERNLRTATKALAALEDKLSGIIGARISVSGHPITSMITQGMSFGTSLYQSFGNLAAQGLDLATPPSGIGDAAAPDTGGGTGVGANAGPPKKKGKVKPKDEGKLQQLKPELAGPLRQMLEARPSLRIGGGLRSSATQEAEFRKRYRPRPEWKEKSQRNDRVWKGIIWEKIDTSPGGPADMAAPGSSLHEIGLAADLIFASPADRNWVINNAKNFGLDTGYTGTGKTDDEPFHIQPQGYYGKVAELAEDAGSGSSTVSTETNSSASIATPSGAGGGKSAPSDTVAFASVGTAGATAAELSRVSLSKQVSTLIEGVDKTYQMSSDAQKVAGAMSSSMGDASGPMMLSSLSTGAKNNQQGNNFSITISPNITINSTGSMNGDLQGMAREIGRMLENEVKVRMMRTQ